MWMHRCSFQNCTALVLDTGSSGFRTGWKLRDDLQMWGSPSKLWHHFKIGISPIQALQCQATCWHSESVHHPSGSWSKENAGLWVIWERLVLTTAWGLFYDCSEIGLDCFSHCKAKAKRYSYRPYVSPTLFTAALIVLYHPVCISTAR